MHKGAYWHAKIFLQGQKSHTCQQCRYHRILGKTPIIKMTFLWSPFLTLSLLWMSFFDLTLPPLLYPSIPLTAVFSLSHHHLSLGLCHSREKKNMPTSVQVWKNSNCIEFVCWQGLLYKWLCWPSGRAEVEDAVHSTSARPLSTISQLYRSSGESRPLSKSAQLDWDWMQSISDRLLKVC